MGIKKADLNKVGSAAIKISFIPCILEGITIAFLAIKVFGFSFFEGATLGFIIAAVSPAVIVPRMLALSKKKLGTEQGVPTLILAGSSMDDVFAITLFTAFVGLYLGNNENLALQIVGIPVSIVLGIGLGAVFGGLLVQLFERFHMRDTKKVLVLIGVAVLLTAIESWMQERINIAALLGVMTMGFILMEKKPGVSHRLSLKLNKIWVLAEIVLFMLVGAAVDITVAVDAGLVGILVVVVGLLARSLGVLLAVWKSHLIWKERLFCVIAYLPKATVQAAIGAIPLSLGFPSGDVMLAVAVISILFTAPLGAIGIEATAHRLLAVENV